MTLDATIRRGSTFDVHTHPEVEESIVVATEERADYLAAKVADKRNGEWEAHWVKLRYLADEANLGATDYVGEVDESTLAEVEAAV